MRILSLVCLLLLSFGALADQEAQGPDNLGAAVAQQREIRAALEVNDSRYDYLGKNRRQNVLNAQDRLFAMTEGKTALEQLSPNDQVRAFNQLKRIEALLVHKDADRREVCEHGKLTGTNRQQLMCYDKAEQDERRDRARDSLMFRPACTTKDCFGG